MTGTSIEEPGVLGRVVELDGLHVHLLQAGSGRAVIAFGTDFGGSAAHRALAGRFCVTAFGSAEPDAHRVGAAAARWIQDQGHEAVGLVGLGEHAAVALWCAAELGERASALVLVSPRGLPLASDRQSGDAALQPHLRGLAIPKAILIGTEDPVFPRPTSEIKRSFSKAHVVLVFGAGADLHTERPGAFESAAGDFLDRQARFRLATESVAVLD